MFQKLTTLVTVLILALAGAAAAHDHHDHDGPEPHVIVIAEFEVDGETYYVVNDHGAAQLWQETNGLLFGGQPRAITGSDSGLQIEMVCVHDDEVHYGETECDEDEIEVQPDIRITSGVLIDRVVGSLP